MVGDRIHILPKQKREQTRRRMETSESRGRLWSKVFQEQIQSFLRLFSPRDLKQYTEMNSRLGTSTETHFKT